MVLYKTLKSLLGDFRKFLVLHPAEGWTTEDVFNLNSYMESLPEEKRTFMQEVVKTQHFHQFIEKAHQSLKEKNEVSYFLEGIRDSETYATSMGELYSTVIVFLKPYSPLCTPWICVTKFIGS